MDEYEDAALNLGQGIRNLRDLIEAERERQEASNDSGQTRDDADRDKRPPTFR